MVLNLPAHRLTKLAVKTLDIVPSRDEVGHGTMIAGIAEDRNSGKQFSGVASEAEFVVVVKTSKTLSKKIFEFLRILTIRPISLL